MRTAAPKFLATLATGLLAGAFLYGFLNVVPTFYEVPLEVHLQFRTQLMNHNSITMQLLMLCSVVIPIWFALVNAHSRGIMLTALLAALLALTALLVTRFGNVPINQLMKTWKVSDLPANWKVLLQSWDRYNTIRTCAALGCFISLVMATQMKVMVTSTSSV